MINEIFKKVERGERIDRVAAEHLFTKADDPTLARLATGVRNRFSTVGTWMATITRANRSDRSFILGGSGHPEEPYTWESPVHQGHHSNRDN